MFYMHTHTQPIRNNSPMRQCDRYGIIPLSQQGSGSCSNCQSNTGAGVRRDMTCGEFKPSLEPQPSPLPSTLCCLPTGHGLSSAVTSPPKASLKASEGFDNASPCIPYCVVSTCLSSVLVLPRANCVTLARSLTSVSLSEKWR